MFRPGAASWLFLSDFGLKHHIGWRLRRTADLSVSRFVKHFCEPLLARLRAQTETDFL